MCECVNVSNYSIKLFKYIVPSIFTTLLLRLLMIIRNRQVKKL